MARAPTPTRALPHKSPRWLRELCSIAITVAVLMVARGSLADHYVVPTGSMEPTVLVGDRIFVNKAAFGWRAPASDLWLGGVSVPERGSVVVLDPPEAGPVLLKRVVALPGDRVQVRAGRLILNGESVPVRARAGEWLEVLGQPHAIDLSEGGGPDFGPRTVPPGYLLVMGDNRGNSRDGRSFGFVRLEKLRGRAVGVYARQGRFGWWGL